MELRKRKAPEALAPAPAPKKKSASSKVAKAATKVKEAVTGKKAAPAVKEDEAPVDAPEPKVEDAPAAAADEVDAPVASGKVAVGETITLKGFGGTIETNDGKKTTLEQLVEESEAGVVLFTYPRASTPGCTKQACMFRDEYTPLTKGGLAIYGLSTDSPKANTTFQKKHDMPFPLLCDPGATLLAAIGLRKTAKSAQRGVFVVNKAGKVLLAEPGSPVGTVESVRKIVETL
jgi:peroxiredoxin Q/BCP